MKWYQNWKNFAVISLPALWLLCCCFLVTTSCSAEIADFSWCSLQGREDVDIVEFVEGLSST